MNYIWKVLDEYPDYEVCSDGRVARVYSDGTREEIEPYSDFEIVKVKLTNYRGVEEVALGYLILNTFDPYRGPGGWSPIVYLDEDPWNCSLDNMRWKKKNMRLIYEKKEQKVADGRRVYCHDNDTVYDNAVEASKALRIDRSGIVRCCRGEIGQTNGYHFSYNTNRLDFKEIGRNERQRGRKVYCKNLEDGSVRIFKNQKEAVEEIGGSVKMVLSKKRKAVGNYILSYEKDDIL